MPDVDAPPVILGSTAEGTVAPGILAMVERGVARRPELATEPGTVRLRFDEGWPAVLVTLGAEVEVADDDTRPADVEIRASLPHLLELLMAPLAGGVPNPLRAKGRVALGKILTGPVEIDGRRTVAIRLLRLLSLAPE